MKPVFCILVLAISWAAAEHPAPSYYHSSYDDMYAHESPRQSASHRPSYSRSPAASSYPSPDDPNVEHEVIIQHHHYPAGSHSPRVIQHGTPEYSYPSHTASHTPVASTSSKKSRVRSRPHYSQSVRSSAYDSPKSVDYASTAEPSLYSMDAYSSPYKQSSQDYKSYPALAAPVASSDDYGIDAYTPSHTGDYGTPSTYQNQPSYKVASHSYSPPSYASSSSSGSYSPPVYEPHQGGYKLIKSYRGSPSSGIYETPVKTSYKTASYSYPKGSYGTPKYVSVSSRPSYSVPKTIYGSPKPPSYAKPSYYRSTKTYAPTSSYGSPSSSYAGLAPTYASPSASYSFGSPSTKPHGYSYTEFDKPMEKGYGGFVPAAAATPEDTYGGVYSAGSGHYQ